ncbi:MAG: DUF1453 domain-containing protein [Vicinamibacteria bacterium]
MPLLLIPLFVVLALVALIPFLILQRYRMGTSRQRARGWLATINVVGIAISLCLFLLGAAFTNIWIPGAFTHTVFGFACGCLLGMIGLRVTRWEPASGALHYTPNRLLVLGITLVVIARIFYGMWRGISVWRTGGEEASWLGAVGVAGSMAAGAVVLGYYFAYWLGVRRRFRLHAGPKKR